MSKAVTFIDTKTEYWLPGAGVGGKGNAKLLCNGCRVAVLQEKRVLELGCTTM